MGRLDVGSLEVITGCMFSGKTEELIRRINEEKDKGKETFLFKPRIDGRYHENNVVSHDDSKLSAFPVNSTEDILGRLEGITRELVVIGIDEAQFLDDRIIDFCLDQVRKKGRKVIIAGLDLDYRGEPFKFKESKLTMQGLIALSYLRRGNLLTRLYAKCNFKNSCGVECGRKAGFTQRLNPDGSPAHYQDDLVVVGAKKTSEEKPYYEARCSAHHFVPGRPQ